MYVNVPKLTGSGSRLAGIEKVLSINASCCHGWQPAPLKNSRTRRIHQLVAGTPSRFCVRRTGRPVASSLPGHSVRNGRRRVYFFSGMSDSRQLDFRQEVHSNGLSHHLMLPIPYSVGGWLNMDTCMTTNRLLLERRAIIPEKLSLSSLSTLATWRHFWRSNVELLQLFVQLIRQPLAAPKTFEDVRTFVASSVNQVTAAG